jgi:hypothetical protein
LSCLLFFHNQNSIVQFSIIKYCGTTEGYCGLCCQSGSCWGQ